VEKTQAFKRIPKMRIEGNVRLKDMDMDEWSNEATYLGVKMDKKTQVGKPHRIRQTESQSDQSKTVPQ